MESPVSVEEDLGKLTIDSESDSESESDSDSDSDSDSALSDSQSPQAQESSRGHKKRGRGLADDVWKFFDRDVGKKQSICKFCMFVSLFFDIISVLIPCLL